MRLAKSFEDSTTIELGPALQHWTRQLKAVAGSFGTLAPGTPMQRVIWRGKQMVPSITGRQPYEVPVYRLDNEHWDNRTA
jgi:hypothetical protein